MRDCLMLCQVCFFHILYHFKSWNRSLSEGDEQVPAEKCSFENKPGPIGQLWSGIARSTHSRAQSPHLYSEDDDDNACVRVSWGLREGVWDVGPPAAFLDCCSSPAPWDKSTHIPPSHSSESLKMLSFVLVLSLSSSHPLHPGYGMGTGWISSRYSLSLLTPYSAPMALLPSWLFPCL